MKTIFFLVTLLLTSPLAAQTQRIVETPSPTTATVLQNAATANGNGTVWDASGYTMANVKVECASCSGGTAVMFEQSPDNSNWESVQAARVSTSGFSNQTVAAGVTLWQLPIKARYVRARILNYSAGTVTVTAYGSMAVPPFVGTYATLTDAVSLNSDASNGTPIPSIGTFVMGSDGTNSWPLRLTSAGRLQVDLSQTAANATPIVVGDGTGALTIDGTVAATQSGTWNINNISGTISLPSGASTLAEQQTQTTALQLIDNLPNTLGSTTSGQSGALALGAVTTAAPSYTNAQSNALSLTTAGLLRTDGSGVTQPVSGTVTVGTFPDNEPINVAQMNGVAVTMGNGASGTGVQRVTIANDSTGTVAATQSGTWNVNNISGTVSLPTGAATSANQTTAITALQLIDDPVQVLGTDTYTEATSKGMTLGAVRRDADTTLVGTTNEFGPLQMDANGRLKVEVFSGETLPVSGTVTTTPPSNASTNVAQFGGTNVVTGTGASGSGIPRVTLSNDSSLAANQSVNVAQINGVTPLMGTGNTGTGSHRVTIATDQVALAGMGVGATAAAPPANTNYIGGIGSGATGGLLTGATVCDSQAFLDMTTATTSELVALTASRKIYVCSMLVNADGATTLTFKRGTGSACGTGTTTISPGFKIAANAGWSWGSGLGVIFDNQTAGDALCATSSAAVNLQILVRYAKY